MNMVVPLRGTTVVSLISLNRKNQCDRKINFKDKTEIFVGFTVESYFKGKPAVLTKFSYYFYSSYIKTCVSVSRHSR